MIFLYMYDKTCMIMIMTLYSVLVLSRSCFSYSAALFSAEANIKLYAPFWRPPVPGPASASTPVSAPVPTPALEPTPAPVSAPLPVLAPVSPTSACIHTSPEEEVRELELDPELDSDSESESKVELKSIIEAATVTATSPAVSLKEQCTSIDSTHRALKIDNSRPSCNSNVNCNLHPGGTWIQCDVEKGGFDETTISITHFGKLAANAVLNGGSGSGAGSGQWAGA